MHDETLATNDESSAPYVGIITPTRAKNAWSMFFKQIEDFGVRPICGNLSVQQAFLFTWRI